MKQIINKITRQLGFEIEKPSESGRYNLWSTGFLRRIMNPQVIIDVGVGHGTPVLYSAFPSAYLVLVEPLEEFASEISALLSRRAGVLYKVAAGSENKEIDMRVDVNDLQRSSALVRSVITDSGIGPEIRKIRQTKLDSIVTRDMVGNQKALLKIDVEGAELDVIKGGSSLLDRLDHVIAEVSIAPRFENEDGFSALVCHMRHRGFMVHSILSIQHVRDEPQPRYLDVVFKKCTKPLSP